MDRHQQLRDIVLQLLKRHERLFARIAAHHDAVTLFDVLGADLDAHRHALHLVFGKLPAGCMVGIIQLDAEVL